MAKEKFKTYGGVFDAFTRRKLFEIESKGLFTEIESPIFVGKEAHVFSAATEEERVVALKIYRLETCDFNRMYDYIKHDRRYVTLSKQKRKVIFAWAQREYRNLLIAREAGVRVPTPLHRDHHILVLEFIGDMEAAPRLKDAQPSNLQACFEDILSQLKRMYQANLIHGDLSAFNILLHHDKPVLIDFSQATTRENPLAEEYLKRDVHNLCAFFKRRGLATDEEQVLSQIQS